MALIMEVKLGLLLLTYRWKSYLTNFIYYELCQMDIQVGNAIKLIL